MDFNLYDEYGIVGNKKTAGMLTEVEGDGDIGLVICPGGGYSNVSEREGEPVAKAFTALGYKCYVLHYSVTPNRFPTSFTELACAIDFVKKKENKPVGVLGFSAGGHLAASMAALHGEAGTFSHILMDFKETFDFDCRPDFAILAYPVISYKFGIRHAPSFANLCGRDKELKKFLSLENQVNSDTPPCFIWHTETDRAVPKANSIRFKAALDSKNIANELILYKRGPHGLALGNDSFPEVRQWINRANGFVRGIF